MNCKICTKPTDSLTHPTFFTKYHICSSCGFIRKDEEFHLSDKDEFSLYQLHNNSIEDENYVAFFERFLQDAVFPFTSGGKDALDFGSGPSPVLAQLMERDYGYKYTIHDKFYAPDTQYEANTYDLITATEVMEHIADPVPVFSELKDLLADDGILAVMTLFAPNTQDNFFGWHYLRDQTHVSIFTLTAMEIIADQVGLEIIYSDNKRYTTFKKTAF